jgi:hypothetical protein
MEKMFYLFLFKAYIISKHIIKIILKKHDEEKMKDIA